MSNYVDKNLGKNESVVLKAKLHPLTAIFHPFIYFSTELALTNKSVIGKTGMIKSKSLNAPLNKIQNVSVSSGFLGKIFKWGKIAVTTAGGEVKFACIKNAEQFKTAIFNQMDIFEEEKTKAQAAQMAAAMSSAIKH